MRTRVSVTVTRTRTRPRTLCWRANQVGAVGSGAQVGGGVLGMNQPVLTAGTQGVLGPSLNQNMIVIHLSRGTLSTGAPDVISVRRLPVPDFDCELIKNSPSTGTFSKQFACWPKLARNVLKRVGVPGLIWKGTIIISSCPFPN